MYIYHLLIIKTAPSYVLSSHFPHHHHYILSKGFGSREVFLWSPPHRYSLILMNSFTLKCTKGAFTRSASVHLPVGLKNYKSFTKYQRFTKWVDCFGGVWVSRVSILRLYPQTWNKVTYYEDDKWYMYLTYSTTTRTCFLSLHNMSMMMQDYRRINVLGCQL